MAFAMAAATGRSGAEVAAAVGGVISHWYIALSFSTSPLENPVRWPIEPADCCVSFEKDVVLCCCCGVVVVVPCGKAEIDVERKHMFGV